MPYHHFDLKSSISYQRKIQFNFFSCLFDCFFIFYLTDTGDWHPQPNTDILLKMALKWEKYTREVKSKMQKEKQKQKQKWIVVNTTFIAFWDFETNNNKKK